MINIIYEDELLLIIDKPPGIVVDKSETQTGTTLEDWLESQAPGRCLARLERAGIVHRLDKDTSGVMLVAKTKEAFENLQRQFKERKVKKEYLALVHGWVEQGGKVEGALGRNPKNREKFTVIRVGKEAETEYEPLSNFEFRISNFETIFKNFNKIQKRNLQKMNYGRLTLLRCFPLTGRTHQIRVHLKYIGHPVVSDEKYTGRKRYRLDKRWCPRIFLHARKIGFRHPVTGEWMEVESELPEDLEKALKNLEVISKPPLSSLRKQGSI